MEFQTRTQWSRSKLQELLHLVDGQYNSCELHVESRKLALWFRRLLHRCKRHAFYRLGRGRLEAGQFDLSLSDLQALYDLQAGRCAYSGIPLKASGIGDWQVSVERLDNKRGYVRDNVVLICQEFQSVDHSIRAANPTEVHGSPQWSAAKMKRLVSFLKHERTQRWFTTRT